VVTILGNQFQWPLRLQQSITVLLIAGLFVTVVLAWYHGEKGRQRFSAAELLILGSLMLIAAGTLSALRSSGADSEPLQWPVGPASPMSVVAVLPFENLGGDPGDAYLADGIHEDILTHLSGVADLTVISRRSVLRYAEGNRNLRQIGAELGARSLMEGSVRRDGNRLRVTVQLIDAVTDGHIWANTYDRRLDDVFEIQTDVARQVAAALEATLTPSEQTRMGRWPAAAVGPWELVQRARAARGETENTRGDILEEERLLRLALEVDPEYALAWALLASNFSSRPWNLGMAESWADSSLTAAGRAVELDPELAQGYAAFGDAYNTQGFLDGAEENYRRAIDLNPNLASAYRELGRIAAVRGRFDQAIVYLRQALRRDPNIQGIRSNLGHAYASLGDLETATGWFQDETDFVEERSGSPLNLEAWAAWWAGNLEDALLAERAAADREPESPVFRAGLAELLLMSGDVDEAATKATEALTLAQERENVAFLFYSTTTLGLAKLAAGDSAAARVALEASRDALSARADRGDQYPLTYLELAVVHEGLGSRSQALRHAQRAVDMGSRHLHLIEFYPGFDGLRSDPAFQEILRRVEADVERMRHRVVKGERDAGIRP
jgi:TolB-like protein/Tfp pilus assembly protein PilF